MVEEMDMPREYFENRFLVDVSAWEDFRESLDYTSKNIKILVEPSPLSSAIYVSVRGMDADAFYKVYADLFDEKRSLGTVTDSFLRESVMASRDWNDAFSYIRKLRTYFSGVALVGDELCESRLMGDAMYGKSETDEMLETLSESIDMSIASSMYIDELKRSAMKQMNKLRKSNAELKKENEHLKDIINKKKSKKQDV